MEPEMEKQLAAKIAAEKQWQERNQIQSGNLAGGMGIGVDECAKTPREPHPVETVMAQIEEAEEVLFQRLTKIKELKREAKYLGRREAKLVLDLIELFRPRY